MATAPPLIPYPPPDVRSKLPPPEWQACLESWILSVEHRLRMPPEMFSRYRLSDSSSGFRFLATYLALHTRPSPEDAGSLEAQLHRQCYFLLKRLLIETSGMYDCSADDLFNVLSAASSSYGGIPDWRSTLKVAWKRCPVQVNEAINSCKSKTMHYLSTNPAGPDVLSILFKATTIVKSSAEAGVTIMTGTDYLEALITAYSHNGGDGLRRTVTEHAYYCLMSLITVASKQSSVLLDHLYLMRSEAERQQSKKNPSSATLLSDLICSTSFLKHLRADETVMSNKRGQSMLDGLIEFRQHNHQHHPQTATRRTKQSKDKQRAHVPSEMHMHKATEISQIHDLFPDLHTGYILRLLDHFSDDAERVIAALLEPESLPQHLRDQGAEEVPVDMSNGHYVHDLAPHSTPPLLPQRKNVFDNDDFDNLRISSTQLHKGRKEISHDFETADHARSKAAILAALAAFDSDDDERDDTYDVADVGASVDNTLDIDIRSRETRRSEADIHEESLFKAWKANPELFGRDTKTRILKARQDLKRETGMTDEQIEGLAIMLRKDPKAEEKLERKYVDGVRAAGHRQTALASSRWQASSAEASHDEEEAPGTTSNEADGRRTGQAGIRGTRNWNRGRGGTSSTSGPADDPKTQAARRRKEQGRGRGGANHSRREGRAKKMGRGMGPVG